MKWPSVCWRGFRQAGFPEMPDSRPSDHDCANQPVKTAILGCGYVADFYMATSRDHRNINIVGAYDINPQRLVKFSRYYNLGAYKDLNDLLSDAALELVLNLTNPQAHYDLTKACLEAGKHVYSEKPLAMESVKAAELAALAREKKLYLATAPCSMLGETAQTMWKALREDAIGPVRLVYASFDDGMIHRFKPTRWKSASGAPWPAKDEFEIGCTYEHAAYVLSWLAAFFGPARRVQSYASIRIRDKGIAVDSMVPDFTVGCIEYDNDVVARVTCSIVAPMNKSIVIIGEKGTLYTKYVRNDASPVYIEKTPPNRIVAAIVSRAKHLLVRLEELLHLPFSITAFKFERKYPYARKPSFRGLRGNKPVDFLRGPADMAEAIWEGRPCRLSSELGVHMTELIETLQYPERFENPRIINSSFDPPQPLPWK
jgi:predicted dehydrogenase